MPVRRHPQAALERVEPQREHLPGLLAHLVLRGVRVPDLGVPAPVEHPAHVERLTIGEHVPATHRHPRIGQGPQLGQRVVAHRVQRDGPIDAAEGVEHVGKEARGNLAHGMGRPARLHDFNANLDFASGPRVDIDGERVPHALVLGTLRSIDPNKRRVRHPFKNEPAAMLGHPHPRAVGRGALPRNRYVLPPRVRDADRLPAGRVAVLHGPFHESFVHSCGDCRTSWVAARSTR